jgi:hypothetical protein
MQRPHGTVIGTAVSKTIGQEGGVIQSTDASITVTISAGAVSSPAEFKIQQVESTLPGSKGPSFRLLPEGVAFGKPVTIQFSYAGLNLAGMPVELLYLAYQDSEGYYHMMNKTERNTTAKTLTVQSTHFSDWAIFAFVEVTPVATTIKKGASVTLQLTQSSLVTTDPNTDELEIAEPEPYERTDKVEWSKTAQGIGGLLVSSGAEAEYTAPDAMGVQEIVCTIDGVEINGRNVGKVLFLSKITVVDPTHNNSSADGYIKLDIDGAEYELKHNLGGSFYNNTNISGTFTDNPYDPKQISILINAPVKINHEYVFNALTVPEAVQIDLGPGFVGEHLHTWYNTCNSTRIYPGGSLKITKVGAIGDFVEGTIICTAYGSSMICPIPGVPNNIKPIKGSFKILRGF